MWRGGKFLSKSDNPVVSPTPFRERTSHTAGGMVTVVKNHRRAQLIGLALGGIVTLGLVAWACVAAVRAIRELRRGELPGELKRAQRVYMEMATHTTDSAISFAELLSR